MITRRRFAFALGASAAIPALARSGHAQAQTTLDVFYAFPSFARFHEPVAAEFMRANPAIRINFRAPAPSYDEGHQTMVRQALTNQLPDLFYSGFHLLPELARTLARREQIVALDPLLAAEGEAFRSANYSDRLLELGSWNDLEQAQELRRDAAQVEATFRRAGEQQLGTGHRARQAL